MQQTPSSITYVQPTQKIPVWQMLVGGLVLFSLGWLGGQGKLTTASWSKQQVANKQLSSAIDYSTLDPVYQALRANYDGKITNQQVLDGLKHGLAESTKDPYTEYFSATEAEQFNNDLQGTITGVGAKLEKDTEGNIVVVAPLDGSPAERAGLKAKDIIIAVDDKSTAGMSANDAVLKIRGKKDTQVKLTVVRNKSEQLNFTITRDAIHVPTVTSKILDGNVGYLQVSQFSDDTDELAAKAAQSFKDAGVEKVVLDLRDNPGGEVTSAVNLSNLWLGDHTLVVQQKRGSKVTASDYTQGQPILGGTKVVVLVNAGSASASEIVALALRDQVGAKIIGEKSYGKGVVQQLIPFDDGSSLKVTVAKWYSPKGTNIDKKGITPDQEVKISDEDVKAGNDAQLKVAETALQ
jgi:carboxyl-terminal processing protease